MDVVFPSLASTQSIVVQTFANEPQANRVLRGQTLSCGIS
jgi:hypothetical protein